MKLREWIDKDGNKINIPKSGDNNTSPNPNGFKKRLYRLVKYHEHHPGPTVEYVAIDKLTEDTIEFTESHKDGEQVKYVIYIGAATEAWRVQVTSSRGTKDDDSGMGWPSLLKQLRYYITVPVTGTPAYKELLTEWVDSKGNKINLSKNTSTSSKSTGNIPDQTYRFERLVAQIQADKLVRLQVLSLTDTILALKIGNHVPVRIERKATFPPYDMQIGTTKIQYTDYEDVLDALIEEGIIANTDLCESLDEWVDKNGNKVTLPSNKSSSAAPVKKTNKEKFEELVKYMESHKDTYTTKTEVIGVTNTGFKYSINCKSPGIKEYTITLEVSYSRFNSYWQFEVYKNGDYIDDCSGRGFKDLLYFLRYSKFGKHANIPDEGTKEYDSLCEWVDSKGNKITLPKASSNAPTVSKTSSKPNSQVKRYSKLIKQIDADGLCASRWINKFNDTILDITLDTTKTKDLNLRIVYDPTNDDYELITNGKTSLSGCDYEKDILPILIAGGVIGNTNLCESASSSIADDFKTYENLWD